MNVGRLEIEFASNVARLLQDVGLVRGSISSLTRDVDRYAGMMKTALSSITAGLSVAALSLYVKKVAETGDEINKLAQKTGIAVEELSKLKYAADLSGVNAEGLAKGVKELSKSIVEAGDNTSKSSKLFQALGVDIKGGPNKALEQLADRFAGLRDGEVKTTLATQLFGKAGMDLIPLLNQGGDGLRKMRMEAEQLGVVWTEQAAKAAEEFNDQLKKMELAGGATGRALVKDLLEPLTDTAKAVTEASRQGGLFSAIWVALGSVFPTIGSAISGNGDQIRAVEREIIKLSEDVIPELRRQVLLQQAIGSPVTKWADDLKAAELRMFALQVQLRALNGEFDKVDDQASRRARQGRVLNRLPNGVSEAGIRDALGGKDPAQAKKEADELNDVLNRLLQTEAKLSSTFMKDWTIISSAFATGALSVEEFANAYFLLIKQQPLVKGFVDEQKHLAEEAQKMAEALGKNIAAVAEEIEKERIANQTRGMTRSMIEDITIARLDERLATLRATEGAELQVKALEEEIKKRKELRDVLGQGEQQESQRKALEEQGKAWSGFLSGIESAFRDTWDAFVSHGKSAGEALRNALKRTLFDWIYQALAKPIVLQLVAGMSGMGLAGAANASGPMGVAGSVSNFGGMVSGLASLLPGGATGAAFGSAATSIATSLGVENIGILSMIGEIGAFIPVAGAVIAGVALLIQTLNSRKGGPKDEGQFTGAFDSSGRLIGPAAAGFNIVGTTANGAAQQFATTLGQQIAQAIVSFGGTPGSFQVGAGIVRDPRGSAPTFVDTLLRDSAGRELLRQHNANVGRSDEDLQAELTLQSQRVILAALQSSTLPPLISGILNSIVADSASLDQINAVMQQAQQAQALWNQFEQMFSTGAEMLAKAQDSVNSGFSALGLEVPKSSAEFAKLVRGLDLSTDAGREMFQALMAIAPAFKAVEDASAAAAEQMRQDWESVQQAIDTITGRNRGPEQLAALAAQFQGANSQFGGLSAQQLVQVLTTITEQDFQNYSAENQALIKAILELAATMTTASTTIVEAVQRIEPTTVENDLTAQFQSKYGSLIQAQPTLMEQMSLQYRLMQEQIAKWQSMLSGMSPVDPMYQGILAAIKDFEQVLGKITTDPFTGNQVATGLLKDISDLTILQAQYGDKAEALFNLQKWYDSMKAMVGSSSTALEALDKLFHDKWQEILDGVASSSALDGAKMRLADWWRGLFLDQNLSPLSLQERFAQAKSQYADTLALAQAGDVTAIGNLSGISETVLQLARQLFASSPAYTALFREISEQTAGVAGISSAEVNSRLYGALPTSGTLASSADIAGLTRSVNDLIAMFQRGDASVKTPEAKEALDNVEAAVSSAGATGVLA